MESRSARSRKKPGAQLNFGLRIRTWGGKRRNAGRPPNGTRAGVTHARRADVSDRCGLHITARVGPEIGSLRGRPNFRIVMASLAAVVDRYGVRVSGMAAMGNHIHVLCEAADR